VLSRPDFTLEAKTAQALGDYRLAVQKGSVYETEATAKLVEPGYMASRNLLVYSDISKAVDDLKANRVDLVWLDLLPAQNFAQDGSVKLLAQDLEQQLYVIGMPKGASVLQSKINDALTQLQNDGTSAKLAQQYLKLTPDQIAPLPPAQPEPVTPRPTPAPPGLHRRRAMGG
jgi:ABC-type amino acid transport substrate-binding protein